MPPDDQVRQDLADACDELDRGDRHRTPSPIRAATEFLRMLTFGVIDGNYDGAFEPEVKGVVYRKDGGDKATIFPVQGFKGV